MNPVEIACICPGIAHAGDTVTLKDPIGFRAATMVRQCIARVQRGAREQGDPLNAAEFEALLAEIYLLYCIESWTLVDAEGKPMPVSKDAVQQFLLTNLEAASQVAEVADELYTKTVILPLLPGASMSLPPSSTDGSTSATNGIGKTPPKRSKPFSTSTTATAGTAVMTT